MEYSTKEAFYKQSYPAAFYNVVTFIAPEEPQAGIIKWAYQQTAQGFFNTEQIYKESITKGFSGTNGLSNYSNQ